MSDVTWKQVQMDHSLLPQLRVQIYNILDRVNREPHSLMKREGVWALEQELGMPVRAADTYVHFYLTGHLTKMIKGEF